MSLDSSPDNASSTSWWDPDRHTPATLAPLDDSQLAAAIPELVDPVVALRAADGTYRSHPRDLDGAPSVPARNLYFGAAGVDHVLSALARRGLWDGEVPDLVAHARAYPDEGDSDAPSWLLGRAGVRGVALRVRWDESIADALADDIVGNAENPTWETLWGSPGTMLAACAVASVAPDPDRWQALFLDSAERLLARREPDGMWTQDLYGRVRQQLGAGHGYVGNVQALLAGRDWLGEAPVSELLDQAAALLGRHAIRSGPVASWWPETIAPAGRRPLLQWCHGAPGVVTSFRRAPPHDALDTLLVAAGEAIWRAGCLAKSAGLCHGSAGNGYAFLVLYERTGEPRWLERARVFAAHALAQVRTQRRRHGLAWASLFTGDPGVACYFASILARDATVPLIDVR